MIVTLSPHKTRAPPFVNEVHDVKAVLLMVMLSDPSATYTAPALTEIHLVKFVLIIVPLFPTQSIAPPRPDIALDT